MLFIYYQLAKYNAFVAFWWSTKYWEWKTICEIWNAKKGAKLKSGNKNKTSNDSNDNLSLIGGKQKLDATRFQLKKELRQETHDGLGFP